MRATALDLKDAVIVTPTSLSGQEKKAITMLIEEAEKRTRVRWPETTAWPASNVPVIAVGTKPVLEHLARPGAAPPPPAGSSLAPEGYQLCVRRDGPGSIVYIVGHDARGVLFGVGRLLRELQMRPGSVTVDDNLDVASAPKYALRGHQLGYRPKCNSYDAWDLPTWEQYYRDLAVFGCNAIELIPPRSDDASYSPHFPRPPMEMMVGMSSLADSYGLDVWVWYPAMDKDYSDPKTVEFALREWGDVFAALPRIDAVFVPGGDPGHTPPRVLMALLEKQTQNLRRYHPKAQMWVSPQSFDQAWLDEFLVLLNHDQPAWLTGVVFGPQVRISLPRLRELVPAKYPIRHYPDITHSRQCQYPVPDWDVAYAVTEARECINPRPEGEATIFRQTQPYTVGFLTYSEGCNDDVNKTVWSALGWDPDAKVLDILRQYSRYFIGERYTDGFAQGLLSLERDWQGPLVANESVGTTLAQFQAMEKAASPADLKNWRFQQALFRAYYDNYVRHRLLWETDLEAQAMERLRAAPARGALRAIDDAKTILDHAVTEHVNADWRAHIFDLGEALFQSIGMQLSVEKYKASAVDRGASLDTLDFPLNNRFWLAERFNTIRKLTSEPARLKALEEILHWTNPGPGGFYDDLGNPARQPHLVQGLSFDQDPGRLQSASAGFEEDLVVDEPDEAAGLARRISWMNHAETLYDTPLQMHYSGLAPKAQYKVRVLYGGDNPKRKTRLLANQNVEIHPYIPKPVPFRPLEFAIPLSATAQGELTLSWYGERGLGGNGRGCQVSEVWLVKELPPSTE
ncbi:MAG TPA: hypothetical protein VNZ64_23055 [Candidatus Acidoferrum sp.]|jgi:hypothetical protein|nr:hypothetical protein [Candidatus Acidoferrum sp.]